MSTTMLPVCILSHRKENQWQNESAEIEAKKSEMTKGEEEADKPL